MVYKPEDDKRGLISIPRPPKDHSVQQYKLVKLGKALVTSKNTTKARQLYENIKNTFNIEIEYSELFGVTISGTVPESKIEEIEKKFACGFMPIRKNIEVKPLNQQSIELQ